MSGNIQYTDMVHCEFARELERENAKLREAAQAVVDRWRTMAWKDAEPTAALINRLRDILLSTKGTN